MTMRRKTEDGRREPLIARFVRHRLRGLIQIAVSAVLLALILRQVHWAEVWDALRRISLRWLAVAWGLFLAGGRRASRALAGSAGCAGHPPALA